MNEDKLSNLKRLEKKLKVIEKEYAEKKEAFRNPRGWVHATALHNELADLDVDKEKTMKEIKKIKK